MYTSIQMVEQIDWRKLIHQRSSPKVRMTKVIMSDETLEERVIAVGKKRNMHPVFYHRERCRIECGHPGKLLTMRRGRPY